MTDDFDNDFEDVMAAPKAAPTRRDSLVSPSLRDFCDARGLTIRRPAEFHFQVMSADGAPLIDFWPTTRKYRLNAAPAGQRARAGGPDAIINDLTELLGARERIPRRPRVEPTIQPEPRPVTGATASFPAVDTLANALGDHICERLADRLTHAFERALSTVFETMLNQAIPMMDGKPREEHMERDEAAYAAPEPSVNGAEEEIDPPRSDFTYEEMFPLTYHVALHALIVRSETCDPKEVSKLALAFAAEGGRNLT